MITPRTIALVVVLASCGDGGGTSLPPALESMRAGHEITPFDAWRVPGVDLYRVTIVGVADLTRSSVVGVDARGALVTGPALMERMGVLPPDELATRALAVLLGAAHESPRAPTEPRPRFVGEDEWALVTAPTIEDGTLVFWRTTGDMDPELVEVRIDTTRWTVESRRAVDVLLARGRTVVTGAPFCAPVARCGCWSGCERLQWVRLPNDDRSIARLVVGDGEGDGELFVREERCEAGRCLRVCAADRPDAHCHDALVPLAEHGCAESCPPSEAPFHCDTYADRCERVAHTVRTSARLP